MSLVLQSLLGLDVKMPARKEKLESSKGVDLRQSRANSGYLECIVLIVAKRALGSKDGQVSHLGELLVG